VARVRRQPVDPAIGGPPASRPAGGAGRAGWASGAVVEGELAPIEQAGSAVGLETLAPARRAVLERLKHVGEDDAESIAGSLGVTVGAVRQLLVSLEGEGLIAHRDESSGPGRPRRRYCLTPRAEALWPKRYGQLANQLLNFVENSAPVLVEQAFEARGDERVRRAQGRLAGKSLEAQVAELATILSEDGYMAEWRREPDGSWMIVEHNCAILDVAVRYQVACRSELSFIREVLPAAVVERVQHVVSGGHFCAYLVTAAPSAR